MAATGSSSREVPMVPPLLSADFAEVLRFEKRALIDTGDGACTVTQTGAACLADPFPVPVPVGGPDQLCEPLIETFVIEADGSCAATGTDTELIAGWLPIVASMADRVLAIMARHRITLRWPAYLTASLLPIEQVTTTPHFDDDVYNENDGVGVVAIVASHAGPRIACEPLGTRRLAPMLAIEPADGVVDRFAAGAMIHQQAPADRIVVFPGFGQIHAGPVIDDQTTDPVRRLLVFRAGTEPAGRPRSD